VSVQINPTVNGLALVAATPEAGYSLVASPSGNIVTWQAPNDGKLHQVLTFINMDVTVSLTGGQITGNATLPDGSNPAATIFLASLAAGQYGINSDNYPWGTVFIAPGGNYSIFQNTGITLGAAKLWASLWAF
jgi:hypothetical protein